MALGGTYGTGTISLASGGTVVTGAGTGWALNQILEGDVLYADGAMAFIGADATSETSLSLMAEWTGADLSAADYVILKTSWKRFDPALTQAKVRELLARLTGTGVFYTVEGEEPDPAIGEDEQYALKTNEGSWKLWQKIDGQWVLQGSPLGINPKGTWSSATAYVARDVVARSGSSYMALQPGTNKDPLSEPTYWMLLSAGGTRYDIAIWDVGRPLASETLTRFVMPNAVSFAAALAGSMAKSEVAATASSVFSLRKNGVQFATITFGAAQTTGVFAGSATAFATGDVLSVVAPSVRDATLANISATLVGSR